MVDVGSKSRSLGQILSFLARLFEDKESYSTHPGVGVTLSVKVLRASYIYAYISVMDRGIGLKLYMSVPGYLGSIFNKVRSVLNYVFFFKFGPIFELFWLRFCVQDELVCLSQ